MIAGSYNKSMFSFVRNHQTIFQSGYPFYIPTGDEWEFLLLHILASIGIVSVLDFGHSNRCVVISRFNLHFSADIWCGTSFHMLICHTYIFFGELSVKIFALFLKLDFLFCCVLESLCIWQSSFIRCVLCRYADIFPSLWFVLFSW